MTARATSVGAAERIDASRFAQLAEAAERSARATGNVTALGEMTRGITHDFRNLLCMLSSGLNVAEANSEDPTKLALAFNAIRQGLERGQKLTDRLLAFAGNHHLEPGLKPINTLLAELRTFLSYGAGPGIRVVLNLAPDLPSCLVDPPRVTGAIFNLVVNARDAMPSGGVIRISTSRPRSRAGGNGEDFVRLRIRDSGGGMAPDVLGKIFEPFFTTKGDHGTGLGIPQVQALMRQVGGKLRVRSVVGKGTTFDLYFPVQAEPSVKGPDNWRQLDRWADEGGAILVPAHTRPEADEARRHFS